jgi:hypothetical protein
MVRRGTHRHLKLGHSQIQLRTPAPNMVCWPIRLRCHRGDNDHIAMITAANTPHTITNALMICFSSETDIGQTDLARSPRPRSCGRPGSSLSWRNTSQNLSPRVQRTRLHKFDCALRT